MRSNFNQLLVWLALIDFLNILVGLSFYFQCPSPKCKTQKLLVCVDLGLIHFNPLLFDSKSYLMKVFMIQEMNMNVMDSVLIRKTRNLGLFPGEGFRSRLQRVCLSLPLCLVSFQKHPHVLDDLPHHGPSHREISRSLQV